MKKSRIVVESRPVMLPAPVGEGFAQRELIRCGKPKCKRCRKRASHGPYWYVYFRKGKRLVSRYLGKSLESLEHLEAKR